MLQTQQNEELPLPRPDDGPRISWTAGSSSDHPYMDVEDATTTEAEKVLLRALREPIDLPCSSDDDASSHGLREAWGQWLRSWSHDDSASVGGNTALLLVRAMECCSGRYIVLSTNRNVKHLDDYSKLQQLTHSICSKLTSRRLLAAQNGEDKEAADSSSAQQVELEMQELAQCVLQSCSSIDKATRQAFLHVAKSYYYLVHCSPETVYTHISKVIFEDVV